MVDELAGRGVATALQIALSQPQPFAGEESESVAKSLKRRIVYLACCVVLATSAVFVFHRMPVVVWFFVGFCALGSLAVYRERGPQYRWLVECFATLSIVLAAGQWRASGLIEREEALRVQMLRDKEAADKTNRDRELTAKWPAVQASVGAALERSAVATLKKDYAEGLRVADQAHAALAPYVGISAVADQWTELQRRVDAVAALPRRYVEAPRIAANAMASASESTPDQIVAYHDELEGHRRNLESLPDDVHRDVPSVRVAETAVKRKLKAVDRAYRMQLVLEERYARLQRTLTEQCGPTVDSAGEWIAEGAAQRAVCRRDVELAFERRHPLP